MKRIVIACVLALLVAGCSSKPSTADAKRAVSAVLETTLGMGNARIENFEINGCVDVDGADGVACDASGTIEISQMGHSAQIPLSRRFRFSKASGTWVAHPM